MKKLILFISCVVLFSCGNKSHEASSYNDKITKHVKLVLDKEAELINVIKKNNEGNIDTLYHLFLVQIDNSIDSINKITLFENDTLLKDNSLNLLSLYKSIAEIDYKEVVRIAKIPDAEYTKTDDEIIKGTSKTINETLNLKLNTFIEIQNAFAKEYAFAELDI